MFLDYRCFNDKRQEASPTMTQLERGLAGIALHSTILTCASSAILEGNAFGLHRINRTTKADTAELGRIFNANPETLYSPKFHPVFIFFAL